MPIYPLATKLSKFGVNHVGSVYFNEEGIDGLFSQTVAQSISGTEIITFVRLLMRKLSLLKT